MSGTDDSLMLEILKAIQSDVSGLKMGQQEVRVGLVGVREDVHSLAGRILGLEKSFLEFDRRLERIEKRLDLVEA